MKKVLGDIVGGFPRAPRTRPPDAPRVLYHLQAPRPPHSPSVPSRRTGAAAGDRPARAVTLLFVMNGFTRPQIIAMFIFRTAALLVIQFNGGGI